MLPKAMPEFDALKKHVYLSDGQLYRTNGNIVNVAPDTKDGYRWVSIGGCRYALHRIVLALKLGRALLPSERVDHIDGDPQNNHPDNLRISDSVKNSRNQKMRKTNKSGTMGVRRCKGKWRAVIGEKGRNVHLGYFDDFNEAVAARKNAEKMLGYDESHGER